MEARNASSASIASWAGSAGEPHRPTSFTDSHSFHSADAPKESAVSVSPASPSAGRRLHVVESTDDFNRIIRGPGVVLVYFSTTWCPPCRLIEPKFLACMDMYPSILFAKVDTDDFSEIAQGCEVEYTPTFQFYRGGEKFDEYVGSDAEQLRGQIALALASKSP